MKLKLPEYFNILVNIKQAVYNGIAVVIFLSLMSITKPQYLTAGFVFGLLGGSTNDLVGWLRNKEAITDFNSKKEEDGE